MKDICNKFTSKIGIDFNSLYFLYWGDQINEDLTYVKQKEKIDKEKNTMNLLVHEKGSTYINKKIVQSKEVICPKCGEDSRLKVKDYKINIFEL